MIYLLNLFLASPKPIRFFGLPGLFAGLARVDALISLTALVTLDENRGPDPMLDENPSAAVNRRLRGLISLLGLSSFFPSLSDPWLSTAAVVEVAKRLLVLALNPFFLGDRARFGLRSMEEGLSSLYSAGGRVGFRDFFRGDNSFLGLRRRFSCSFDAIALGGSDGLGVAVEVVDAES